MTYKSLHVAFERTLGNDIEVITMQNRGPMTIEAAMERLAIEIPGEIVSVIQPTSYRDLPAIVCDMRGRTHPRGYEFERSL